MNPPVLKEYLLSEYISLSSELDPSRSMQHFHIRITLAVLRSNTES
jgi:hypothetical protein